MTPKLSSLLRSGLIALGVSAGVSATPAFAVPIAAGLSPAAQPAAAPQGMVETIQFQEGGSGRFSDCNREGRCGSRFRDGWRGRGIDGRAWRRHWDDGDRWRSRRHWRDGDWRDRRHFRRHSRRFDRGPSIYLDFSFPAYRYYEPRYYAPRYYAPRRVYRSGRLSSAHVEWCYSRYRSYRAYDNTFQPYNGPRRQCWSPYS
jgi:hypothetical protein